VEAVASLQLKDGSKILLTKSVSRPLSARPSG